MPVKWPQQEGYMDGGNLQIDLETDKICYRPGDRLSGTVKLHTFTDIALGRIDVSLIGRTKSKVKKSNGQTTSTYRGRAQLFRRQITLHNDHYTHKAGDFSWPFEFIVPQHVESVPDSDHWKEHFDFIATDHRPSAQDLPPTFNISHGGFGKTWEARVEYGLEVTRIEPSGARLITSGKSGTAFLPLNFCPSGTVEPIDLDDPRQRLGIKKQVAIKTLMLLPEHTMSPPTLKDRARTIFKPDSVPRYAFDLDMSYSAILQSNRADTVPFVVSATVRTDSQSTTVQPDLGTFYRYPSIKIVRFTLSLISKTRCRCVSIMSNVVAEEESEILLTDKRFMNPLVLAPQSVAWDQKIGQKEDIPASIDLGRLCNVKLNTELQQQQIQFGPLNDGDNDGVGTSKATFFTPSFITYNIARQYAYKWEIEIECAGKRQRVKGQSPRDVQIIGPIEAFTGGNEGMTPWAGGDDAATASALSNGVANLDIETPAYDGIQTNGGGAPEALPSYSEATPGANAPDHVAGTSHVGKGDKKQ